MNRVFVINEPLKQTDGTYARAIDLRPAETFGELIFLSPPGEPAMDPEAWLPKMRELLATWREGDYLLPVGHPVLIVAASAIAAAHSNGTLCILKWTRGRYVPVTVNLFATKSLGEPV